MNLKNAFTKVLILISSIFLSLICSCQVGLGEAVDTEPPKVVISYPPEASVIKNEFVFSGTCEDDREIKYVKIEVSQKNGDSFDSVYSKNLETSENLSADKKSWQIKLNTKDSNGAFPFKDGTYSVKATAYDVTNKASASASRTYEIDNTVPVFIIKNPGITDVNNPASYGSIFKVVGTIADDHEISQMKVSVKDEAGKVTDWIEEGIETAGGTEVVFARYNKDDSEGTDEYSNRYLSIYGKDTTGDKKFTCSISVTDAAKEFINPKETENNTLGNSTNALYLNDSVYESLMSKNSEYELTASDFKKILNGTFNSSRAEAIPAEKLNELITLLKNSLTNTLEKPLAFKLNKAANPTYSVTGFLFDSLEETAANSIFKNKAAKQGKVTFRAMAGLDGTYFKPDSLKVYLFGPYDSIDNATVSKIYSETTNYYNTQIENAKKVLGDVANNSEKLHETAKAYILLDNSSSQEQSTDDFSKSLTLPGIAKNKYYVFAATGTDVDGLEFISNGFYGFIGEAAGYPPTVTISAPVDGLLTNKIPHIKGTISSTESNIDSLTYKVLVRDELNNSNLVETLEGNATLSLVNNSELEKSFDIDLNYAMPEDKMYKFDILLTGKDSAGLPGSASSSFNIDTLLPVVKTLDITPVAVNATETEKAKINGKVNINIKIDERNLKNAVLSVSDGTKTEIIKDDIKVSDYTHELDTTKNKDLSDLTITLTVYDNAGNSYTKTNTDYFIDQSTDKPSIESSNAKDSSEVNDWTQVINGINLFGVNTNNTMNIAVSDDDGIKNENIVVKICTSDKTTDYSETNNEDPKYVLKYENNKINLPKTQQDYFVVVTATDSINSEIKTTKEYYISVNESKFNLKFIDLLNNTKEKNASNAEIKGSFEFEEAQLKYIKKYKLIKDTTGSFKITGEPITFWYSSAYWDSLVIENKPEEQPKNKIVLTTDSTTKITTFTDTFGATADGTEYFGYVVCDNYGTEERLDLTLNSDLAVPTVKSNTNVSVWQNINTQKIEVIVGDNAGTYNSGIDTVKYTYNSATSELAPGKVCDLEDNTEATEKKYQLYSTILQDLKDGSNSISVVANDKVGNFSLPTTISFMIDTVKPEPTISLVENQVLNNKKSITFKYSAKDIKPENADCSGLKSIKVSTSQNMANAITVKEYNSTGVITTGTDASNTETATFSLTDLNDGTYSLYIQAEDYAGNKSEIVKSADFIVDSTLPAVKITTPAGKSTVNKTITLSGTVNDNNLGDKTPVLKYKESGATDWNTYNVTTDFTLTGQTWTISNIDTTKIEPIETEKTVDFMVEFTDLAGNSNTALETPYSLKINQLADRPNIKLTNIDISGSAISSNIVSGVLSDDDGIDDNVKLYRIDKSAYKANETPETTGNQWKEITVEAGTGIFNAELKDESEGKKEWYFYIKDSQGGKFCTKSDELNRLTINGADNTDGISFSYDITPPDVEIFISHDGTNWENQSYVFGGSESVYVKAVVTESVGMRTTEPVILYVGGVAQSNSPKPTVNDSKYTYIFEAVSVNSYKEGTLSIQVVATDSSSLFNKDILNITVDKTPPVVNIISPTTSMSDAVSSAISVKGIVQDSYSGIEKLEYTIPKKGVTEDKQEWKEVGTASSWEIKFASGAADSSDSLVYYANAKTDDDFTYDITESGTEGIYKVPFWFRAKDTSGNSGVIKQYDKKDLYVLVDSEGGKPTAWINSPEDGTTTSGKVTIYGGASDNVSVESVQIQIDVDGNDAFDGTDYSLIKTSKYLGEEVASNIVGTGGTDWYIPVSGTNSWKYTIDTTNNTYSLIKIRVRAYDGDGQTRDWTNPITVKLDSETPTIKNMRLVQYGKDVTPTDSSVPVTEKEYIAGMYISNKSVEANGEWYFVADVADNGNVSSINFTKINSSDSTVNIDLDLEDKENLNTKDYTLRIPLKTSETGRINYSVEARDANNGFATANILINIDSTAPGLYNTSNTETTSPSEQLRLKSTGLMLGTEESNSTVVNSNSYFTLGDVVSESGSGLDYVAFYFERKGTEHRVYNPMFESSNKSVISTTKIDGQVYINEDGLAALYLQSATRNSEDSFELTSENKNASVGGLVKIAGNYCRITGVSGTTVKFTPTVSTVFREVELILAQVVDHQITESPDSNGKIVNDDGDGMIESIQQIGSSYNWQASINSLNIPDGPINICVAAIDKAGNITHGKIATKVENNRPRIAKVLLGTDLNGNGKYDWNADSAPVTVEGGNDNTNDGKSYGEFSYYSALNENSAKAQSVVALASKGFKVISGLMILPEFVGGNTSLGYILENPTDLTNADKKTGTVAPMTDSTTITSKVNKLGSVEISTQISKFGGVDLTPTSENISLTFWDKTEETTQGTNSQWALLKIPVNLMSSETEKPKPVINPFYWNSKTDNSIYIDNEILQGHIELEGDLPEDVKTSLGSEPKVSGKIKIQGTITDNVRISSINMSAAGIFTNVTLASYEKGSWKNNSIPNGVVSFEVNDESISQEGHKVNYTLVLDTEKLSSVAANNVNITISAKDWKNNASSDVTYIVDVVPYVTQIWTQLSESERTYASMYARTSTGEYVVRSGEEITIYGWNLNNSPSVSLSGNTISGTVIEKSNVDVKQGSYGFKFNVPDVTSGELNVTVNSIPALNNINEKDARGSAEEDLKTSKTYDNYYNRQPNGQNNNELDDDIKLDVWNFKTAIKPNGSNANYVTMKVGPYLSDSERSGRIGFSFKNGSGYFNMPGYKYGSSSGDRLKLKFLKTDFTSSDKIYMWTPNPKIEPCGAWEGKPVTDLTSEGEYYVLEVTGYSSISYKFSSGKYKSDSNMTEISSEGVWEFDSSTSTKKFIRKASLQTSSSDSPTLYSQTKMGENYQGFTYNTFAFDNNAETYGMALCSDTSGKDYISANLQFFSRAHGHSDNSLNRNYYNAVNARRIENTTFYATDDPNYGTDKPIYNDERTKSLAMSTYVKDKNTYVYSAYYDQGLKRIVFRMGAVLGKGYENANNIDYGLQDLMGYTGYAEGGDGDTSKVGYYGNTVGDRVENRHRNSTQSTYVGNTENPAYKYVKSLDDKIKGSQASVAVGSLSDGSAVIAWFDDGTNTLKMTKVTFAQMTGGNLYNTTLTPKEISTKGGEGVSLVVDSLNGIHLAYESNEGSDLYYSYVSSDFAIINEVLVDSKNDVGSYCSIDVGRGDSTTKKWIPYITYKSNVATRTKIAYPVLFDSNDRPMAGATSGGFFTGNWAISMIPSENKSIDDKINVGLNKDWSDGVIHEFNNSSDIRDYSVTGSYSICESTINYGNGTKNPVLGYATSTGAIEMAQKK